MRKYLPLVVILLLGGGLRLTNLASEQVFFGDQAWFFLSARDALWGHFPRLGITASATWLNQGSVYTFLLIPALLLGGFDPVWGAGQTIVFGLLTVTMVYFVARYWYSNRAAVISALVMATSPLVIFHDRLAYHTSPIPLLVTLLILAVERRKGWLVGLLVGLLYQLELATVILWPVVAWFVWWKKVPVGQILVGFLIGIWPFVLFAPRQLPQFAKWVVLRLWSPHTFSPNWQVSEYFSFLARFFSPRLPVLGTVILALALGYHLAVKTKRGHCLWLAVPWLLIVLGKIPSPSYLIVLHVPLALLAGGALSRLGPRWVVSGLVTLLLAGTVGVVGLALGLVNPASLVANELLLSRRILQQSNTSSPQLVVLGPTGRFATAKLPYDYLVWWLDRSGHHPTGRYDTFFITADQTDFRVLK